jgi:hypothetical protein
MQTRRGHEDRRASERCQHVVPAASMRRAGAIASTCVWLVWVAACKTGTAQPDAAVCRSGVCMIPDAGSAGDASGVLPDATHGGSGGSGSLDSGTEDGGTEDGGSQEDGGASLDAAAAPDAALFVCDVRDAGDPGLPTGATCPPSSTLTYGNFAAPFFETYCLRCHSVTLVTEQERSCAPDDHNFDTEDLVRRQLTHVAESAAAGPLVLNLRMPFDAPFPTDAEREMLGAWIACGAP